MHIVCGKCGREIEVTEQEARRLDGTLVCPQCLDTVKVDVSRIPPRVPNLRTRHCPKCGELLPPGVNFCNRCGERITAAAKIDAAPTPPVAPKSTPSVATAPPPYRRKPQPIASPTVTATKSTTNKPTYKKMSNNRKNNKTNNADNNKPSWWLSPFGCLTATVIFVLFFFLIYYLIGSGII